jgi:NuA3 HAT complex component NTO1
LILPKPTFRHIETFAAYEKSPGVGINFVEKTLANVGYQESDIFLQPRTLMRGRKTALEDDVDFILQRADVTSNSTIPGAGIGFNPRVEYDMDEQDERWLDSINAERTAQGVDIIRPQYFEITMTLIEKEWHALEKRKLW